MGALRGILPLLRFGGPQSSDLADVKVDMVDITVCAGSSIYFRMSTYYHLQFRRCAKVNH